MHGNFIKNAYVAVLHEHFSIRESTRGSKRTVYTYNGRREKLATPVEYTINGKDGARTVTKEYKNRLTKVKKAEVAAPSASA